jgi:hypothetical protein
LNGMKILKLYAWEMSFQDKVRKKNFQLEIVTLFNCLNNR